SGRRGRRFKSYHPDQISPVIHWLSSQPLQASAVLRGRMRYGMAAAHPTRRIPRWRRRTTCVALTCDTEQSHSGMEEKDPTPRPPPNKGCTPPKISDPVRRVFFSGDSPRMRTYAVATVVFA